MKMWLKFLCLVNVVATLTGCGYSYIEPQKDFFLCLAIISTYHNDFGKIVDARPVERQGLEGGWYQRELSDCLASKGFSYPPTVPSSVFVSSDEGYFVNDVFLVTWVDKENKYHMSVIQNGKELMTGAVKIQSTAPDANTTLSVGKG